MNIKQMNDEIYFIEIIGIGENISNKKKRVFLSKSGAELAQQTMDQIENTDPYDIETIEKIKSSFVSKLSLYTNKKDMIVGTRKNKESNTITICRTIESSFRGTSFVKRVNKTVYLSATGRGRIGEHTEFIAEIEDGGYVIVYSDGRYAKGWKYFGNKGGKLIEADYFNEGKYCEKPSFDDALIAFGLEEVDEER